MQQKLGVLQSTAAKTTGFGREHGSNPREGDEEIKATIDSFDMDSSSSEGLEDQPRAPLTQLAADPAAKALIAQANALIKAQGLQNVDVTKGFSGNSIDNDSDNMGGGAKDDASGDDDSADKTDDDDDAPADQSSWAKARGDPGDR
jgi:hypothetical protein